MLSPKHTFKVGLGVKPFEPEEGDTYFVFRYPTCDEWPEIAAVAEDKHVKETPEAVLIPEVLGRMEMLLRDTVNLTDSEDQPIRYVPGEKIGGLLERPDLWRLFWRFHTGCQVRPEQEKKSESPSPTASAESATANAASVATGPAK